MSDYRDAAHEAYERLKWAENNRPTAEELAKWRKTQAADERAANIQRLRRSVA